jgi:hypothetical protein
MEKCLFFFITTKGEKKSINSIRLSMYIHIDMNISRDQFFVASVDISSESFLSLLSEYVNRNNNEV